MIDEIRNKFLESIKKLRVHYMSFLIENQMALRYLDENESFESSKIRDGFFIFGDTSNPDTAPLYTRVEIDECINEIFDVKENINRNIRLMTLNLVTINEELYVDLYRFYLREYDKDKVEKRIHNFTSHGGVTKRIKKLEQVFDISFGFNREYINFEHLYKKRNNIVHAGGIVNSTFLKGIDNIFKSRYEEGSPLIITEFEFSEHIHFIEITGNKILYIVEKEFLNGGCSVD